ncbi:MAG: NAD-dependent epimerase/dehydratase family protein [Victivallaceae bacterium]
MSPDSPRRILITGGTGFFGRSILAARTAEGRPETELVILSRDPAGFLAANPEFRDLPGVSYLAGDVRDFAFPAGEFSAVLHAATPATPAIPDAEAASIILDGTRHVLDFCRGRGVGNLLFVSSGAVYGPMPPGLREMPETLPCHPVSVYGRSKLAAEQLSIDSGVASCKVARCFAFVGEYLGLNLHFAIGNFIRDCLLGQPINIQGDGSAVRSYLYSGDLVKQLWALLDRPEPRLTVNLGSDRAVSIRELAELVRRAAGTANPITVAGKPDAYLATNFYVPDIKLARRLLATGEPVSLEAALERVIRFHRQMSANTHKIRSHQP